jgi:hypothetical protein
LCEQNKLANFDLFLAKCVSTGFFKKALWSGCRAKKIFVLGDLNPILKHLCIEPENSRPNPPNVNRKNVKIITNRKNLKIGFENACTRQNLSHVFWLGNRRPVIWYWWTVTV